MLKPNKIQIKKVQRLCKIAGLFLHLDVYYTQLKREVSAQIGQNVQINWKIAVIRFGFGRKRNKKGEMHYEEENRIAGL